MRERKVTRLYCDHCNKGGFQRPAMAKHERGCTNNPNRVCRVCECGGIDAKPLAELIAFAKTAVDANGFEGILSDQQEAKLREMAGDCPCCLLATLRQSSVVMHDFDFAKEMKAFWKMYNEEHGYRE